VDQLMQVPFQRKKEHSFERKQRMCTVWRLGLRKRKGSDNSLVLPPSKITLHC
jgi:hypothetical protein